MKIYDNPDNPDNPKTYMLYKQDNFNNNIKDREKYTITKKETTKCNTSGKEIEVYILQKNPVSPNIILKNLYI